MFYEGNFVFFVYLHASYLCPHSRKWLCYIDTVCTQVLFNYVLTVSEFKRVQVDAYTSTQQCEGQQPLCLVLLQTLSSSPCFIL